jgi:virginiamycin B lyase
MKVSRIQRLFFTLLAAATMASAAVASTVTGIVRDPSGKPTANVFVTAEDSARKMTAGVLTDAAGRFRIDELFAGQYDLRARKAGFGDSVIASVELGEPDATVDLKLQPDDAVHLSTPGAAWLNVLPNVPMKATFVTSCTICHDQGSPLTHIQRDADTWTEIIKRMSSQHDAYAVIVKMDSGQLASWLAEQKFGANLAPFDPFAKRANVATKARLTEYAVGDVTSWAHDVVIEPKTGTAWYGDYVKDELVSVNSRTGEQKVYMAPMRGTGMHTLSFDRDGSLWITLQLVAKVARFDTQTAAWRIYDGFTPGSLNHSFALDAEGYVKKDPSGRLYVSLWGGNRTSLLDPATGKVWEIPVPGKPSDKPYGIAVDSKGLIWYTKYSENMLGFVDPATGQGKEWALARPDSGPHRMHIDNDDNLWIPLSGYGSVLRYNTRSGNQKEIPLPDADCFPYAARYDSKSDRVWITGNGGNAIYALDPKTEKFTTFRMPSILSYGRNVSIDYTTGDLWTALASYPNKVSLRDHSALVRIHHALDLVH